MLFFFCTDCSQNNSPSQKNGSISEKVREIDVFYKKGIGVNVTHKLTLLDDSTYVEQTKAVSDVDRRMATTTISGTYHIAGNKLKLMPSEELSFDYRGNHRKTIVTDSVLKKSYYFALHYEIVNYKDLVLLLNDSIYYGRCSNDFIDIANSINEHDGKDEMCYIYRNADNSSFTVDKNISASFSSPWNEYILDSPVNGKVIDMKKADSADRAHYKYLYMYSENIFTLDIGTTDGIRNGMKLYSIGKDTCSCEMIIMEVWEKQCKGYLAPLYETNCLSAVDYSTKRK